MPRDRSLPAPPALLAEAATICGELKAHVWVTSGRIEVVGCESKEKYGLLARFPA